MSHRKCSTQLLFFVLLQMVLFSCRDQSKGTDKVLVKKPVQLEEHVSVDLQKMLQYAADNRENLYDSVFLNYRKLLDSLYERRDYAPLWSIKDRWLSPADSLLSFI